MQIIIQRKVVRHSYNYTGYTKMIRVPYITNVDGHISIIGRKIMRANPDTGSNG